MTANRRPRWAAVLAVILALALLPGRVFAIADPTSITIDNVRAYSGVLETSDLLVVVKYNLVYASTPAELINDAYVGRFLKGTTEFNSVEPFAYNDKGYGVGVFSFYWTAVQLSADSIEFDDTNSENYGVTFQGKVGVFPAAPSTTSRTITWRDATDTENQLSQDITELARQLEGDAAWAANNRDLIGGAVGGVIRLTSAGEEYFATAVPRLPNMVPGLFESAASNPTIVERDHQNSYSTDLSNFWDNHWVDTKFQTLADTFRMSKTVVTTLFAFGIMLMIAFYSARALGGTQHGTEFGILTMAATLPLFVTTGFIAMEVGVFAGFIALLGLSYAFVGRRSGG